MVSLITSSIIIILSLLFIGLIFYAILKSTTTHVTPPDVKTMDCPTTLNKLRNCDPNDQNSCANCKGGEFACFTVDAAHPYRYSSDPNTDCLKYPEKCTNIPDGTWCLPVQVESDKCNPFTSIPILTQITPELWRWRCYCKYPELVTKAGIDGDCVDVLACDPNISTSNKLVCPDQCQGQCSSDEVCCDTECTPKSTCTPACQPGQVCCKGNCYTPPCQPGTPWTSDPTWDPTLGVCSCIPGYKPINRYDPVSQQYIFECIQDTCGPGTYNLSTNTCTCPAKTGSTGNWTSWVNCPENIIAPYNLECKPEGACTDSASCQHQCWRDPCNPYGYYDPTIPGCVCDAPNTSPSVSSSSIVGSVCKSPCDADNNPCGDRGTCYLNSNGNALCENCNASAGWMQSDDGLCHSQCYAAGTDCEDSALPCCPGLNCKEHVVLGEVWWECQ